MKKNTHTNAQLERHIEKHESRNVRGCPICADRIAEETEARLHLKAKAVRFGINPARIK